MQIFLKDIKYDMIGVGDIMSKFIDALIGHAIGDAMGVPIEFESRDILLKRPVTKMIGYGSHDVPKGTWSDDTSMVIATMISFINKGFFDCKDIMMNFYYWLKESKFTAVDKVFDGSLMRILPVALYSYNKTLSENKIIQLTNDISSLTHAHEISKLGCYIYVRYVMFLLSGLDKKEAYNQLQKISYDDYSKDSRKVYKRILKEDISKLSLDEIKSTGYVVDTLEASIWIILQCNSFNETIIGAINLGEDTDTIGAITGAMAGIIYGYNSIKKEWLNDLKKREYLIDVAKKFENIVTK